MMQFSKTHLETPVRLPFEKDAPLHVEVHLSAKRDFPAVYADQPNYLGSKPDNMKEESEDKNTET